MGSTAQARALENYRKRLSKRGLARFEVLGLKSDRELIRTVARKLSENNPEAAEIRASVLRKIAPISRKKGGILAALRRSPLVGIDLGLERPFIEGRKIDL